jgi:ceroid-lipofuscinosis neuronal protein 5
MHDAIGIRSMKTGMNWTMEWYELDQLFNCTFPHFMDNGTIIWCNQGALCVYEGINDTVWTQYGFIEKVSELSGSIFNSFSKWSSNDNNTKVYYETWTIYNAKDESNQIMYFDSFDCASWVLRAFDEMYSLGAQFNPKINLNYTRLNLYSKEPILLGTYEQIMNSGNDTLINDLRNFYKDFQKPNKTDFLEQFIDIFTYIGIYHRFYFYYNEQYWLLNLNTPYIGLSYNEIKLPGV